MDFSVSGQELNFNIPDSLKTKTFEDLQNIYYANDNNAQKDSIVLRSYIKKAKSENDILNLAVGYSLLATSADDFILKHKYVDKAILITKNYQSYNFPCVLYSVKANFYHQEKKFKRALDYYLLAHDSAITSENYELANTMKHNLGVMKNNIGMYDDAFKYAKESWNYSKNTEINRTHLNSLFLISTVFINNNKLDSASYFNKMGIEKSNIIKSATYHSRFSFLEGVNHFKRSNFKVSIDSLKKSLNQFNLDNDLENAAESYFYLGKSFWELKNYMKSIFYLKKMDSVFLKTKSLVPLCRNGYKTLIKYYKNKRDTKNELLYTSRLLTLDSILDSNYEYLSTNIYRKHETPILISEKEQLITSLNKEKKSYWNYIYLLIILVVVAIGSIIVLYLKQKKDKENYKKIISKLNDADKKKNLEEISNKSIDKKVIINIDKKVIETVLHNLEKFEKNLEFNNNKLTLQMLAKKVGTNSKYLSKIINTYKQKNFSNYLSDLRIEHLINRLHTDKTFRKFNMDAIAKESGFKSSRSLFGVFHKKTGISPAYFIEKLKKDIID